MSQWYAIDGNVICKNVPEVVDIVERFNEQTSDIIADIIHDGDADTVIVNFSGGAIISNGFYETLDNIAKELGRYAVQHAFIDTTLDNEDIQLYIGLAEDEIEARSEDTLDEIKTMLQYLSVADKKKLWEHLVSNG